MRLRALIVVLLALAAWALASPSRAHQSSDAYLHLQADDHGVTGRWEVALRDLDVVLPLDANDDRVVTWGEVRQALPRIEATMQRHLRLADCPLRLTGQGLERRAETTYLALGVEARCRPPAGLPLGYAWMAAVDASHRAVARVTHADGRVEVRLLEPRAFEAGATGTAEADEREHTGGFFAEGIRHLLTGYDHLLFLLCLLLPAVLRRQDGRWVPVARWQDALRPVVLTVTLFTLAHSITLALSALGLVSVPASIVEPAIAASIAVAALDNLRPMFGRWRPVVTFVFGLLHGFGFAGVLGELSLPALALAGALLQFNLGLEIAQLGVVLLVVPLLAAARHARLYRPLVLHGVSVLAMLAAGWWLLDRLPLPSRPAATAPSRPAATAPSRPADLHSAATFHPPAACTPPLRCPS